MLRRYSRGFLGLQVRFAALVGERLGLALPESLGRITMVPSALGLNDGALAEEFSSRLVEEDPLDVAWDLYARGHPDEWEELGEEFHGHRLFGCFYHEAREGGVVRPHLVKNVRPGEGLLERSHEDRRRAELAAMFLDVRESAPDARAVRGNSWLYNLDAYRRLFPPAYTRAMEETSEDEFGYLALWGQFYDRDWEPRPGPAAALLAAAAAAAAAAASVEVEEDVLGCFSLRVLRPRCAIEEFFRFYGVE